MRVLQISDFEKLARDVVNAYTKNGVPLEDGVVKIADDMGLNPDQIQNLVQLANTLAHLSLFEAKDDGNKIVDFSPADSDNVLKKVYSGSEGAAEAATAPEEVAGTASDRDSVSDFFGDFPDLIGKVKAKIDAAPGINPEGEPAPFMDSQPRHKVAMATKIRKVASELDDRKQAAAYDYKEELDKLASSFAHLYGPDYPDFEKSAIALRGRSALAPLSDIRNCLKLSTTAATTTQEKTACVIDADTQELRSLDTLIKFSNVYNECEEALAYLRDNVGGAL